MTRLRNKNDVAHDLRRLYKKAGLSVDGVEIRYWPPTEERSAACRDYAYVDPEQQLFSFSTKIFNLPDPHYTGVLAHEVGHVIAHCEWNDDSENAADIASERFLGIEIKYDPAYGGKGLQMTKNPKLRPLTVKGSTGVDEQDFVEHVLREMGPDDYVDFGGGFMCKTCAPSTGYAGDRKARIVEHSACYNCGAGKPTKNPKDVAMEAIELLHAERKRERAEKLPQVEGILSRTPAIRGVGPDKQPRMAIVSKELSDTAYGEWRVTFFGQDGPHGHNTKKTMEACAQEIVDSMSPPYAAMADADVMEWTTTPEFEKGSRVIAYTQAENTLRWFAQKSGRIEWAYQVIERANDVGTKGGAVNVRGKPVELDALDQAIEIIGAAIRELPIPNPGVALVRNPAWVTKALAASYDEIKSIVPSQLMPQLAGVKSQRGKVFADLIEFGCGAYGCVLATNDPRVVLKVTTDSTEAEFAGTLSRTLVAPIAVEYHFVIGLNLEHDRRPIHLLWRDSAEMVGDIDQVSITAWTLIGEQHDASQIALKSILRKSHVRDIREALEHWLAAVEAMKQEPIIRPLAEGMLKIWEEQHIFFGDVHPGNVGFCADVGAHQDDLEHGKWKITDPGNIVVISDRALWPR